MIDSFDTDPPTRFWKCTRRVLGDTASGALAVAWAIGLVRYWDAQEAIKKRLRRRTS